MGPHVDPQDRLFFFIDDNGAIKASVGQVRPIIGDLHLIGAVIAVGAVGQSLAGADRSAAQPGLPGAVPTRGLGQGLAFGISSAQASQIAGIAHAADKSVAFIGN